MTDCSCHNVMTNQSFTIFGGGERVRTDDLLRARQALSHLSYTPDFFVRPEKTLETPDYTPDYGGGPR